MIENPIEYIGEIKDYIDLAEWLKVIGQTDLAEHVLLDKPIVEVKSGKI